MNSALTRFQPVLAFAAFLLILAFCVLAQAQFAQRSETGYLWLGAAGVLAFILVKPAPWAGSPVRDAGTLDTARGLRLVLAVILLLVGGGFLVSSALLLHLQLPSYRIPSDAAWSQFYTGALLAGLGALCLVGIGSLPRPDLTMLLLVGVLAGGVFLRVYQLDSYPLGVWYDEAINALTARDMLKFPDFRPIFEANTTTPHLLAFAASMQVFGWESITGPRIMSALLASAGIVTAYLFGRELRGKWFGLTLAIILATLRWSLNFSRIAMTGAEAITFIFLTFYFALRFTRYGRLRDAFWFGVALALGVYFYRPYVFQLIPIGIYMLLEYPFRQRPWRLTLVLSAMTLITAVVVLLPLLMFMVELPQVYFSRLSEISIFNEDLPDISVNEALLQNAVKHLEMFHLMGDRNGRHNLPAAPMLDPVTGSLFIVGIFIALRDRQRWRETVVFLISLVAGLWSGVFSVSFEAPQALRSIGVIVGVLYFAAVGLTGLTGALVANLRSLRIPLPVARGLAVAGALAALIGMVFWNSYYYFIRQRTSYNVWREYSTVDTLTARFFANYSEDTLFFTSPYISSTPPITLLAEHELARAYALDMADPIPARIPAASDAVFMLLPQEQRFIDDMRAWYPNANIIPVRPVDYGVVTDPNRTLFTVIELTPDDLASLQGLRDGSGVLYVPLYDRYTFSFAPETTLEIDGALVDNAAPIQLSQGNHRIVVSPPDATLNWSYSGIEAPEPIRDEYLYHAPITPNGLLTSFYPNPDWQGQPINQRIIPHTEHIIHILPMDRPFSARYQGYLYAPVTGEYGFTFEAVDSGTFTLDGENLIQVTPAGKRQEASITLERGWHEIELSYRDLTEFTRIILTWMPPGESNAVSIGREYLCPVTTICEIPGVE